MCWMLIWSSFTLMASSIDWSLLKSILRFCSMIAATQNTEISSSPFRSNWPAFLGIIRFRCLCHSLPGLNPQKEVLLASAFHLKLSMPDDSHVCNLCKVVQVGVDNSEEWLSLPASTSSSGGNLLTGSGCCSWRASRDWYSNEHVDACSKSAAHIICQSPKFLLINLQSFCGMKL